MCRGTSGCPTKAVGYAMSVIHNSPFLTVGTIVDSVAVYSVPSVLQIQFLLNLVYQGARQKSGIRLGSVIIVFSNGNKI